MEKVKFELFGACLGNGTTVCNKAVEENGDYKMIAHISTKGDIKWFIKNPESYVPEDAMKTIRRWADSAFEEFVQHWQKLSDIQKYSRILDEIGYTVFSQHDLSDALKACNDLHQKVILLEAIYFENRLKDLKKE